MYITFIAEAITKGFSNFLLLFLLPGNVSPILCVHWRTIYECSYYRIRPKTKIISKKRRKKNCLSSSHFAIHQRHNIIFIRIVIEVKRVTCHKMLVCYKIHWIIVVAPAKHCQNKRNARKKNKFIAIVVAFSDLFIVLAKKRKEIEWREIY